MTAAKQNVTHGGTEQDQQVQKVPVGLKVLVVVLGLAILGMLGLIIFTVLAGGKKTSTAKTIPTIEKTTENRADFPDINIVRPADSALIKVTTGSGEIILHFSSPEGDTLIFVDRAEGTENRISIPK